MIIHWRIAPRITCWWAGSKVLDQSNIREQALSSMWRRLLYLQARSSFLGGESLVGKDAVLFLHLLDAVTHLGFFA